jgi:hypothetical protein
MQSKFQQSCMICQLKLVFYLLEFYSLLIRITVHFLFCAIPFETDSHTPGLYAWINGLTVYNVHVMFEISAKTIYMKKIIA